MKDLIIEKLIPPYAVPSVSFQETVKQYDPVPILRLYCTQYPGAHLLQIRATAPLTNDKHRQKRARNLIASISLTIEDLEQITDYVKQYKK